MDSKYRMIAYELENSIPQMLRAGITKFPTEAELCRRFNCSRQTIRAALNQLQDKKLVIKCKGSGTYISASSAKRNVAVILPYKTTYIYPEIIRAAKQFFGNYAMDVLAYETENNAIREREILFELNDKLPAGIIYYPSGNTVSFLNADVLMRISETGTPIVGVNQPNRLPESIAAVSADIRGMVQRIALRLLSEKADSVRAVFSILNPISKEQYDGLMGAAVEAKVAFDEKNVLWLDVQDYERMINGEDDILRAFVQKRNVRGCTVICGNDEIAYHMIRCLKKNEISVPEQVQVVGFDNSYYCTQISPSITSIGTGPDAVILEACRTLLERMTRREKESVIVPMTIFERQSFKLNS